MQENELIHNRLIAPFALHELDIRPGSYVGAGKAIPLVYVDPRRVTYRLNKVLGFGGYSIITKSVSATETSIKKKLKTDPVTYEYQPSLLVTTHVEIHVHRPDLTFTVSNVGEDLSETENKATTSYAQAFKRACSMMGIGAYLYELKLDPAPCSMGKFTNEIKPSDESVEKALKNTGFVSICEETGEPVDWQAAAYSVANYGKILSKKAMATYVVK
jgi:hypothetical protein